MRCPKCGFISFDNLETCLRCKKDISQTANMFQGSAKNVVAPVFLKFADLDENDDLSLDDDEAEAAIEFADPDLEILVDGAEEESDSRLQFAFGEEQEDASTALDLSDEFGGTVANADDQPAEGALDLGMFENGSDEDSFNFEDSRAAGELPPSLEIPEELADISDLSPPGKTRSTNSDALFVEEPEPSPAEVQLGEQFDAEPADDLDFSSMDMEFDLGNDEVAGGDESPPPAEKPPARPGSSMDDDLNFDLDLGGLSIHDDK